MTLRLTIKALEQLQKSGKIKGYSVPVVAENKVKLPKPDPGAKNKEWLKMNLSEYAKANGLIFVCEFQFHQIRRFRFDWAMTSIDRKIRIGIEYNGIYSEKSRHTTVKGYSTDMEKLNLAQATGWTVFQVTPLNYETIFSTLETYLHGK